MDEQKLYRMANAIRALSMDAVEKAASGHPGMPMGMADVATVLFTEHLKFDPTDPDWSDRDRFVLSAGHGSMLVYSLAYLLGYEDMPLEDIEHFRQLGSRTAGHPEYGHAPLVETTTGPLGQGLANAVGFAIAEEHLRARFGADLVDHYTYVIAGDGCLMEGISQEAISLAGRQKLNKLIVLWDDNGITIDGKVSIADQTDQRARFEACGWKTLEVDGHDFRAIDAAITFAKASAEPVLIACQTTIGKGAGAKAGSEKSHGSPLGETEIAIARQNLDWPYPPFDVPSDILSSWREAGQKGIATRKKWQETEETSEQKAQFRAQMNGLDQATVALTTNRHIASLIDEPVSIATRAASQKALEVLCPELPQLLGGSADLTGSNNTKTNDLGVFDVDNRQGRYIHYGIREHGMAAAMNGMALHGGVTPYGGTFLVFSDYCRPSIRLAALMGIQSIFVMTHDSIGLGEDGPTHQPVEHLAALRAIPNLNVFRPADSVETAECWAAALADTSRPSVIALARQKTPQIRRTSADENLCAKGGYVISDCSDYAATLVATGSEVHIAIEAAADLAGSGISVRVVSMPNWRAFTDQADTYRTATIGDKLVVAVEAGVRQGWDQYIGSTGKFVGMQSFGASAPAPALYEHFGITPKAIAEMVRNNL